MPEIEVTDEMIEAGKNALWSAMGYQLAGDPADGAEEAFRAMFLIWLRTCTTTVSEGVVFLRGDWSATELARFYAKEIVSKTGLPCVTTVGAIRVEQRPLDSHPKSAYVPPQELAELLPNACAAPAEVSLPSSAP